MDLGPHAVYIWMSYLIAAVIILVLIGWLVLDGRRQQRLIAELEARGVRRHSKPGG